MSTDLSLSARLRDEEMHVDACDEAAQVLDDALVALKNVKEVTATLGKGIGHLAVGAVFFALWNDTEIAVSNLIYKLTKGKPQEQDVVSSPSPRMEWQGRQKTG